MRSCIVEVVTKKGFITAATSTSHQAKSPMLKPRSKATDSQVHAFSNACLFCHDAEHSMEQCKKIKKSLHKEKFDFLRAKGLCFSCLKQDHMSNSCNEKMTCQVCTQLHPTVLHMKSKYSVGKKDIRPDHESCKGEERPVELVVSRFVGTSVPRLWLRGRARVLLSEDC